MKRMDDGVLAMFEKVHFFDFSGYSAFDSAVKVEIEPLRGFQFFMPYREFENLENPEKRERESFAFYLNDFVRKYLIAWAKYIEEKDGPLKAIDFAIGFANARYSSKEIDKIFEKVRSGSQSVQIELPVNNTRITLRRFGDLLAIGNIVNATNEEEHRTGIRVLKSLCRAENPNNNHGIYELIRGIDCIIPLRCLCPDGGFHASSLKILQDCLKYSPKDDVGVDKVVSVYRKPTREGIVLGQYHGLDVAMNFVYPEAEDSKDIKHIDYNNPPEARRFRKANVVRTNGVWSFHSWDDIAIVLSLRSSLDPYGSDVEMKVREEQFRLNYAGCTFSSRLCSMIMDNWLEHRRKMMEE